MANDSWHEMLATLLQFMLYICRVHYGLSLMKFYDNHVGIVFHTKMLSVKEFNFHNHWTFNVSLSDDRNEHLQEIVSIVVQYWQPNCDGLQYIK